MPSDSTAKPGGSGAEQEQLPCPRCDSTNTKFCYYNNYNFSQPRHFCKSCRRYWTHGGTLRDIPVGGGTRKNAKRSRICIPTAAAASPSVAPPLLVPAEYKGPNANGSFTSLLNTHGPGFWTLGGFGLGLGPGFEDSGYAPSRVAWPFLPDGGVAVAAPVNTWQFENGDAGFVAADCISWPDLAISTPGNALK